METISLSAHFCGGQCQEGDYGSKAVGHGHLHKLNQHFIYPTKLPCKCQTFQGSHAKFCNQRSLVPTLISLHICIEDFFPSPWSVIIESLVVDELIGTSFVDRCFQVIFPTYQEVVRIQSCSVGKFMSLLKVVLPLVENVRYHTYSKRLGTEWYFLVRYRIIVEYNRTRSVHLWYFCSCWDFSDRGLQWCSREVEKQQAMNARETMEIPLRRSFQNYVESLSAS